VSVIEGQVVAFLAARPTDTRLHIDEIDVHRTHQGHGIGRRMILETITWARENGFQTISLTTFRSIPWNGPFYASLGFREWLDPPPAIKAVLDHEVEKGLKDRWAMRLNL
jgi:GNAT superfamily N-acetyltransferase